MSEGAKRIVTETSGQSKSSSSSPSPQTASLVGPVMPCWYCDGKDPEGDPYDPAVHKGWFCQACDERREAASTITRLEQAVAAGSRLCATVVLGVPTDGSVNVGWIDPYAWWDDVRRDTKAFIAAERALSQTPDPQTGNGGTK